jgi:hypothetical protein
MWLTTLFSSRTRIPGGCRDGRTRPANKYRKLGSLKRSFVLRLEILEDRALPSSLMVMNTNDKGPGSLRDTITNAKSGDTIVFAPSLDGQTITLTSDQLTINYSLDIEGPGAGLLTISGNNQNRIFNINEGLNVAINGLTLVQGRAVGGIGNGHLGGAGGGGAVLNGGSAVSLAKCLFGQCLARLRPRCKGRSLRQFQYRLVDGQRLHVSQQPGRWQHQGELVGRGWRHLRW